MISTKKNSYYGPAGGVVALTGSFLEAFVGKAAPDIHNKLNPGKSSFVAGTLVSDTNSAFVVHFGPRFAYAASTMGHTVAHKNRLVATGSNKYYNVHIE